MILWHRVIEEALQPDDPSVTLNRKDDTVASRWFSGDRQRAAGGLVPAALEGTTCVGNASADEFSRRLRKAELSFAASLISDRSHR